MLNIIQFKLNKHIWNITGGDDNGETSSNRGMSEQVGNQRSTVSVALILHYSLTLKVCRI